MIYYKSKKSSSKRESNILECAYHGTEICMISFPIQNLSTGYWQIQSYTSGQISQIISIVFPTQEQASTTRDKSQRDLIEIYLRKSLNCSDIYRG